MANEKVIGPEWDTVSELVGLTAQLGKAALGVKYFFLPSLFFNVCMFHSI